MSRTVGTAGATPQPELLRLGIRGAEFRFGRALSSSEERQYLAAHRRLWGHRRDRDVLEMLARNVRDYESCRKELDAREPTPGKRMEEQRESETEINRRFLAVLAAFRQFVDRVEARLKREYGKASPPLSSRSKPRLLGSTMRTSSIASRTSCATTLSIRGPLLAALSICRQQTLLRAEL